MKLGGGKYQGNYKTDLNFESFNLLYRHFDGEFLVPTVGFPERAAVFTDLSSFGGDLVNSATVSRRSRIGDMVWRQKAVGAANEQNLLNTENYNFLIDGSVPFAVFWGMDTTDMGTPADTQQIRLFGAGNLPGASVAFRLVFNTHQGSTGNGQFQLSNGSGTLKANATLSNVNVRRNAKMRCSLVRRGQNLAGLDDWTFDIDGVIRNVNINNDDASASVWSGAATRFAEYTRDPAEDRFVGWRYVLIYQFPDLVGNESAIDARMAAINELITQRYGDWF